MSSFTDFETETIMSLNGIASGLSTIGGLYMIISYLATPDMQKFSMKLVISLMCSCLAYSFANFLAFFHDIPEICYIEGVIRVTSTLSCLLWGMVILQTSFRQLSNFNKDIEKRYKILLLCNISISLTPPIIISIGHFTNRFVYFDITNLFCNAQPHNWALVFVDVPRWITMGLAVFYTIRLIRILNKVFPSKSTQQYRRVFLYSIALILTWLPGTADRLYMFFFNHSDFLMVMLHVVPTRLSGFINAVIYGKDHCKRASKKRIADQEKKKYLMASTDKLAQEISLALNSDDC